MRVKVGDRVRIRGLAQSDCLGLTGQILETQPSGMFGPRIQRCRVDFGGRVRRILDIHLIRVDEQARSRSVAA